jgi:DNA-binding MarR family transcriptional regulator
MDLYRKDYQDKIQKKFPEYDIEYIIVDDKNLGRYPFIKGKISNSEKNKIYKVIESDEFKNLVIEEKYMEIIFHSEFIGGPKGNSLKNHKEDTDCIIYGEYDLTNYKERELTSIEMYFLKYITVYKKNPLKSISGDWTYNYNLDYKDVLNQFVGQNLVEIIELNTIEKMNYFYKVDDLKNILRTKKLKLSGRKKELIDRILENSSIDEQKKMTSQRCIKYKLTDKGEKLINDVNPSLSRDMDFEDSCYSLVMNNSMNKAYKAIKDFKKKYNFQSGPVFYISLDEYEEEIIGENDENLFGYRKLTGIDLELPNNLADKKKNIISCIIVGDMFNSDRYKITNLIKRILDADIDEDIILDKVEYCLDFLKNYE